MKAIAQKRLKKSKNVFSKCVLDLKGLGSSFSKQVKFCGFVCFTSPIDTAIAHYFGCTQWKRNSKTKNTNRQYFSLYTAFSPSISFPLSLPLPLFSSSNQLQLFLFPPLPLLFSYFSLQGQQQFTLVMTPICLTNYFQIETLYLHPLPDTATFSKKTRHIYSAF